MENKTTLILGATNNESRYAFRAAQLLKQNGYDIYPLGIKKGEVLGQKIEQAFPESGSIHTVTLYVSPKIQEPYYESILSLKPVRIIFNPGTENDTLRELAEDHGIETEYACTLVMLNTGQY